MTRVLVLQQPSSTAAVDRWLTEADPALEVLLVTGEGARRAPDTYTDGVRVVAVPAYDSPEATLLIRDLAHDWRPDRVVSNAEKDVLRAATVRSELGLPGTRAELAVRFRDKVRMKQLFADSGLPTPRWRDVQCVDDVQGFHEAFDEVVLKPRDGVGSQGVHVLSTHEDLRRVLTEHPSLLDDLHARALMVEERIRGRVLHVDGVLDGADVLLCAPSRYLHPPHTFAKHDVASVALDPGSDHHTTASRALEALARGLPTGHGVHVVHLELHLLPDGSVLAGEVAARLGGGMIKATVAHGFGVDLSREGYLLGAGLREASALVRAPRPRPQVRAGHRLWTSGRPSLTGPVLPPWAHGFWAAPGSGPHVPAHSADAAGGVVVEGADEAEVVERMCRVG